MKTSPFLGEDPGSKGERFDYNVFAFLRKKRRVSLVDLPRFCYNGRDFYFLHGLYKLVRRASFWEERDSYGKGTGE